MEPRRETGPLGLFASSMLERMSETLGRIRVADPGSNSEILEKTRALRQVRGAGLQRTRMRTFDRVVRCIQVPASCTLGDIPATPGGDIGGRVVGRVGGGCVRPGAEQELDDPLVCGPRSQVQRALAVKVVQVCRVGERCPSAFEAKGSDGCRRRTMGSAAPSPGCKGARDSLGSAPFARRTRQPDMSCLRTATCPEDETPISEGGGRGARPGRWDSRAARCSRRRSGRWGWHRRPAGPRGSWDPWPCGGPSRRALSGPRSLRPGTSGTRWLQCFPAHEHNNRRVEPQAQARPTRRI